MKSLATNVTLTTEFKDIGLIIGPAKIAGSTNEKPIKFKSILVAVELDINCSKGFQLKAFVVDTDNTDLKRFKLPINKVKNNIVKVRPLTQELDLNEDTEQTFEFELASAIDAIQLQVKVKELGSAAGVITSIRYTLGK